ncbi:MAG: NCS2 family permease [Methyloceanibacter sp.]
MAEPSKPRARKPRKAPPANGADMKPAPPKDAIDRFFGLTAQGSSVGTESPRRPRDLHYTMAYIMFVNPVILQQAGMDHGAVFVATCLAAAAAGSLIMGLYANYPIALAPGMGLNAYFAFTVVPELDGNWQLALAPVFISGLLFLALSLSPLRAWLIDAIPLNLKLGIAAGIGFFLALIGLQNAGVVAADPTNLVALGDLSKPETLLAAAGFLVIAGLAVRKIPGAIIIGMLAITLIAVAAGLGPWHGIAAMPPSLAPTFFAIDLAGAFRLGLVTIVLTLLLVTILDTTGTLIGVARQAGRTGLTAIAVAALFLLALFLAPLAQTVPAYATAPALFFVACLMAASLGAISWETPPSTSPRSSSPL